MNVPLSLLQIKLECEVMSPLFLNFGTEYMVVEGITPDPLFLKLNCPLSMEQYTVCPRSVLYIYIYLLVQCKAPGYASHMSDHRPKAEVVIIPPQINSPV